MKRPKQGTRSIRPRDKAPRWVIKELRAQIEDILDQPKPTKTTKHVFWYAELADKHTNILYTDATGTFPYQSLDGNWPY